MREDLIQPLWQGFHRKAFPLLRRGHPSVDELRRMEKAAQYWLDDVRHTLDERQAKRGRKRA